MIKLRIPNGWCEYFVDPTSLTYQPKILLQQYQALIDSFNGHFVIEREHKTMTTMLNRYSGMLIEIPVPYVIFDSEADAAMFKLQYL